MCAHFSFLSTSMSVLPVKDSMYDGSITIYEEVPPGTFKRDGHEVDAETYLKGLLTQGTMSFLDDQQPGMPSRLLCNPVRYGYGVEMPSSVASLAFGDPTSNDRRLD